MVIFLIFVLIFGLCIGSFLNVLIYRLPRKIPLTGRSFCPNCKKKINWYNNIPLFSFLFLRGKCSSCHSPISIRYPLVELLTGVLFVLSAIQIGLIGQICLIWVLLSGLIAIFFIDLEHRIIPDEVVLPLILLFLLRVILASSFQFLVPALGSMLFFLILYLVTHGKGMGFGDVKFAFLMGLALGFPKIIIALYIAFLTGAFVGIILIISRKIKLKSKIAFGPFLVFATIISILWGEKIMGLLLPSF